MLINWEFEMSSIIQFESVEDTYSHDQFCTIYNVLLLETLPQSEAQQYIFTQTDPIEQLL